MRPQIHYILRDREIVPVDLMEWARWFEGHPDRRVADDTMDGVRVSTVFLGLDHQWGIGPPLLFETMIFGGALDGHQWRYSTWQEAEDGHRATLVMVGFQQIEDALKNNDIEIKEETEQEREERLKRNESMKDTGWIFE